MASFQQNVLDTAAALGISVDEAITLELLALEAWEHVKSPGRVTKNAARMAVASSFAAGNMSRADYNTCVELVG